MKASDLKGAKRPKYGSVKTQVDGITFDSKKEAARYQQLVTRQRAGDVRRLRWQPRYALFACSLDQPNVRDANAGAVSPRRHVVCEYVADFEYDESDRGFGGITWTLVVEDVKSPATKRKEVYRLKRKLFEAQYGITIREV